MAKVAWTEKDKKEWGGTVPSIEVRKALRFMLSDECTSLIMNCCGLRLL